MNIGDDNRTSTSVLAVLNQIRALNALSVIYPSESFCELVVSYAPCVDDGFWW